MTVLFSDHITCCHLSLFTCHCHWPAWCEWRLLLLHQLVD